MPPPYGMYSAFLILLPDKTIWFYQVDTALGVVVFMIFEIEDHEYPSHYDLHIENFNLFQIKVFY